MSIYRRQFCTGVLGGLAGRLLALPARPKLLVWIVVEQFRPDYLDSATPQLSAGGFRRLIEKGACFPDCRHLASSFPASALATLATGAWPAQHGIVADSWYDPPAGKPIMASDEALLATTLAAQVTGTSHTRVFVVSMGQSQAGLFAGTPDAHRYWMDDRGEFATLGDPADWLVNYNSQKNSESARNAKWQALGAPADAPALRTLNFSADRPWEFMALYKSSPFALGAQFDFAGELLAREHMGQANTLDCLCLLVGSSALLGYEAGARSPLMQQMTLHIDRRLEALLTQLSKVPGENAFNLVVTGAHGAPPEPSADSRKRMAVNGESVAQAVEKALLAAGSGRVEKYLYPFLYLDTRGFRDPEPLRVAAARAALAHPAVADYYTAGGASSAHDDFARRLRNSFHPTRSGDVMLSYRPEYVEEYGNGRGISYGSIYNYDIRVPLFFYGPQFRAGTFENAVESVDVAPTLARALGVATPSSSTGRVLAEALAE